MNIDLIAKNRDGQPVLIVKVWPRPLTSGSVQFAFFDRELAASPESVGFGMFVDPIAIRVFQRKNTPPYPLVTTFDTTKVLSHYSADFQGEYTGPGTQRIYQGFMVTLVDVWLMDLAFQWKAGEPPQRDELQAIGLLSRLEGASIFDQELVLADPPR
jgi:hypothetical protein